MLVHISWRSRWKSKLKYYTHNLLPRLQVRYWRRWRVLPAVAASGADWGADCDAQSRLQPTSASLRPATRAGGDTQGGNLYNYVVTSELIFAAFVPIVFTSNLNPTNYRALNIIIIIFIYNSINIYIYIIYLYDLRNVPDIRFVLDTGYPIIKDK